MRSWLTDQRRASHRAKAATSQQAIPRLRSDAGGAHILLLLRSNPSL
jgi:hypothetical protein